MAEEVLLDYVVNRPYIALERQETQLKVLLKVTPTAQAKAPPIGAHIVLVLDVSSSMRPAQMDALKAAARAAIDALRPGDFVSVVAFQSVAYDIISGVRIDDSSTQAMLHSKVEVIDQYQGGGTDLERALTRAEHALSVIPHDQLTCRIVVFTDGQVTGTPEACIDQAPPHRPARLGDRHRGLWRRV